MLDWLKPELIVTIGMYMFIVNSALWAIHGFLDKIKDLTKTPTDNKIVDIMGKVLAGIQKVLDVIGMNPKHK